MKAEYTPGPWRVAYLDCNRQSVVMGEHIEIATCWHHSVGSIEKEMHANASLVAAAPDLLEALNAVEGAYQCGADLNTVMDQVKSAIAKANGESQ